MNVINLIKLKVKYSDLKKMGIDTELLEKALADKQFAKLYKKQIKPFIKYLSNYTYTDNDNIEKKIDIEIIKHHVNSIIKLYNETKDIKYISFIKENYLEKNILENPQVLNDKNFDKLFKLIGYRVFDDNIANIIVNRYSERLLQFIQNNPKINLSTISSDIFNDSVWQIINSNPAIGNTTILDLFGKSISTLNILVKLIQGGLFDGFKYTYENIPESHNFIIVQLGIQLENTLSIEQFDINFIKNIGDDVLKKLYYRNCFSTKDEFSKIFRIYEAGNSELIQDIVNYDETNFYFANVSDADITKNLLDTNIGFYDKKELLLNKYCGVKRSENYYIKLFLSSINKTPVSDEFKEKYGALLNLLNQIYNSSDEEILLISKKLDKSKKNEYKKLIYECEKDGNELIKSQFCKELKERSLQQLNTIPHSPEKTKSGKTVNVYQFTGQPFTMLVHGIYHNNMSSNNDFVDEIINNPEKWNTINDGNNFISTSLITNEYMTTYGIPDNEETIMFGFYEVPSQSIKFMSPYDAGLNRNAAASATFNMRNYLHEAKINTVVSIDDLMRKTMDRGQFWNEIGISRSDEQSGSKLQPDYIVCMDHISESSKRAAEYFGVPIFLINCAAYKKRSNVSENNITNSVQNYETTGMHR